MIKIHINNPEKQTTKYVLPLDRYQFCNKSKIVLVSTCAQFAELVQLIHNSKVYTIPIKFKTLPLSRNIPDFPKSPDIIHGCTNN